MPDAAPPVNRYRRNSSRSNSDSAVLAIISNLSTLHQWFPCGPLLACHLTWSLPGLFLLRSRPWLFTTAARGGLKPAPASRFRGARPHQLSSYALRQPALPSCSWHTTVKLTGIHSFSTRTQFFPARNTSGLAGMSISGTSRKSVNLTVPWQQIQFINKLVEVVAFPDRERPRRRSSPCSCPPGRRGDTFPSGSAPLGSAATCSVSGVVPSPLKVTERGTGSSESPCPATESWLVALRILI